MNRALSIGRDSASGSTWLLIGKIIYTAVLAISTIVLGMFIQEGEYGLYAIALVPSATILLFHDWGVGLALTRFSVQYRHANKIDDLRNIIKAGLIFEVAIGLILMIFSLLMSNTIATLLGRPEAAFLITLVSITILASSIITGSQALFLGFEKIKLSSLGLICQAVVQSALSITLVCMGYGALGIIVGYIIGSFSSAILSLVFLYFSVIKGLPKSSTASLSLSDSLRKLLSFGVPLGINTIMSGIMNQYYFFIIVSFLDEVIIGNYKMALNFVSFITFFTIPISKVLLPAFSKLDPKKEQHLLNSVFKSSVKYTNLLLIPAAMAVIVLSQPLVSTLYADKWIYTPLFLSLAASIYLFEAFGSLSLHSFLTAAGETKFLLKIRILPIVIGAPLALILIPNLGIPGVVLVDIIDTFPSLMISVYWVWKHYNVTTDFRASGKIASASFASALATFIFLTIFTAPALIMLVVGAVIFLLTFLLSAPFLGAVNQEDIANLRAMFSGIKVISKIVEVPLIIMEKPIKLRTQSSVISKNEPN